MTQAIHEIDLMLHLFGPATIVQADMATLSLPIESEDTAVATVHFESGAMVVLVASVATHDASTQFDVIGDVGSVHFPWRVAAKDDRVRRQLLEEALRQVPAPSRLAHPDVVRVRNKLRQFSPRLAPAASPPLHLGYWTAVVDALDEGRPLPIGPEDARRSVELVTAIYTSAMERRPVALPLPADAHHYAGVSKADYDSRASLRQAEAAR